MIYIMKQWGLEMQVKRSRENSLPKLRIKLMVKDQTIKRLREDADNEDAKLGTWLFSKGVK